MKFDNKFTFLNTNDCNNKLTDLPKNVDVMTCQFSGAQWYPQAYNYPQNIMDKKIKEVTDGCVVSWKNKVTYIKPKLYFPSGGPPCFLNKGQEILNFPYNQKTIFFPFNILINKIDVSEPIMKNINIVYLDPGDIINNNKITKHPDFTAKFYNLDWYREQIILTDWLGDTVSLDKVKEYFKKIIANNTEYLKNNHFTQIFVIKTEDHYFKVIINGNTSHDVSEIDKKGLLQMKNSEEEYYLFDMTNKLLNKILNLECDWEEAYLSCLIKLERNPDIYDPKFHLFMRHSNYKNQMDNMLAQVDKNEMFVPESHPNLKIQRWCPHMGADLKNGIIVNNVITCPRHGWQWDITSGECVKGGSLCLKRKELEW
jgi:UDP-MurNAc hydroxylase